TVMYLIPFVFFQAEDGIRDFHVTGVQTCALPISDRDVASVNPCSAYHVAGVARDGSGAGELGFEEELVPQVYLLRSAGIVYRIRSEERRVGKGCRLRWRVYKG